MHLHFGSKTFLIAIGRLLHNLLLLILPLLLLLLLPLHLHLILHLLLLLHLHLGSKTFLMVIGAAAVDERRKEGEGEQRRKGFWFPGELLMEEPGSRGGHGGQVELPPRNPTGTCDLTCTFTFIIIIL